MLFSKKKPAPIAEFGYQDAVDYLRDLEQADYTKILKVVNTYREADKKVKKILNIKDEHFTLDDDDDIADLLLDDDGPVTPTKPAKAKKNAKNS